jgi:hypothetical protein
MKENPKKTSRKYAAIDISIYVLLLMLTLTGLAIHATSSLDCRNSLHLLRCGPKAGNDATNGVVVSAEQLTGVEPGVSAATLHLLDAASPQVGTVNNT